MALVPAQEPEQRLELELEPQRVPVEGQVHRPLPPALREGSLVLLCRAPALRPLPVGWQAPARVQRV